MELWRLLTLISLILGETEAEFTFRLYINSYEFNSAFCDLLTPCKPYFNLFCLREQRATQSQTTNDCPLGVSTVRLDGAPETVTIRSDSDWKVTMYAIQRIRRCNLNVIFSK